MDLTWAQLKSIAAGGGWPAVGIVVVYLLVWLWKSDLIPWELPVRARPFVALVMGQVSGVIELFATGVPLSTALLHGLTMGAGAIALHEAQSKLTRPDKDITGGSGSGSSTRGASEPRIVVVSDIQRSARRRLYGGPIAASIPLLLALLSAELLTGCNMTPAQQAQTAVDVVEAGIAIGDAVCERNGMGSGKQSGLVKFICRTVDVANSLRNTSTSGSGETTVTTYGEPIDVFVAPELSEAFEAKYRSAPTSGEE